MMRSRFSFNLTLAFALACAAITFSLAVCAQAQTITFLNQQSANSMIQGPDGNLYGTGGGGANDLGQIFRMTPTGKVGTIYSFCSQPNCADGENPSAAPILGSNGNLYGAVLDGGNNRSGILYRVTLGGKFTKLYAFCPASPCVDGQAPTGLIEASDGNFYGTTEVGGNDADSGTIFRINPSGKFTLLYTFCSRANCADGASPNFPPLEGSDGNFYGVTYAGGSAGGGVIYRLTPQGSYKVLYTFCSYGQSGGCATGSDPENIVQDSNGNLFGTTAFGGDTHNDGTIFEFTADNQYIVLHQFDGVDGTVPNMGLTLASDGNLYGMTQSGGIAGTGNLFEITLAGEFTSLYNFSPTRGYDPFAGPLFQATNGNFYGTTIYGPTINSGTIFRFSNGLSRLVETAPLAGKVGESVIILGNGLTGSTSVTFNGAEADFTVVSDTYIKATVPVGATKGIVKVTTPSGTLNSNPQFVVTK